MIADGMGGHNAGEVAARLAVEAVVELRALELTARGRSATTRRCRSRQPPAHGRPPRQPPHPRSVARQPRLRRHGHDDRRARVVVDGRLSIAHVGDSRLYLMTGRRLRQVTRDDSWMAAMLAEDPVADPWRLEQHPMRERPHQRRRLPERGPRCTSSEETARRRRAAAAVDRRRPRRASTPRGSVNAAGGDDDPRVDRERASITTALTRGSQDNCTAVVVRCRCKKKSWDGKAPRKRCPATSYSM